MDLSIDMAYFGPRHVFAVSGIRWSLVIGF